MKKSMILSTVLIVSVCLVAGCGTAIKEGVGIAIGAKGLYTPVQDFSPNKSARPLGKKRTPDPA